MALNIKIQPTAEPVTVDEVKARLRLTTTDDDAVILAHISTAREFAESVTGWSLAAKSYRMTLDRFPLPYEPELQLLRPPLVSVDSVSYLTMVNGLPAWQTLDPSEYWVASENVPAVIVPLSGAFPNPARLPGAVRIDYSSGVQAYAPHVEGIRQLAVHLYDHPEAVTAEGLKEIPSAFTTFFMSKRAHCIF